MAFTPKTAPFSGKINAVTLGTGDKAIVIGGQNVMPFYTFDAPIENAPKIGVEISDLAAFWDAPALKEFYAGCTTMADYAKKAETMPMMIARITAGRKGKPNLVARIPTVYAPMHIKDAWPMEKIPVRPMRIYMEMTATITMRTFRTTVAV